MKRKSKTVKKNSLYIVQSGKLGGAEISLLLLLKYLNRNIFNPIVLGPANSDLDLKLKELNIEIINVNLPRIKSKNPIRLVFSFILLIFLSLKIYFIIKKLGISIVHTVSNKRSAIFGILAARLANIPVIWTVRNLQWEGFIDAFLVKNSTRLIAVSDAIFSLFNRNPDYCDKFVKIYNAVDLADFNPELNSQRPLRNKWGLETQDFVVAMVGRLSPEKGHGEFIKAASRISEQNSKLKFLIIGEQKFYGNDHYYRSLAQQSQQKGLEGTLKFIDFENDIAAVMASIDVLVLFSKYESFGRVLIEAMAMEKPVITSDAGGPAEIIEDKKSGILIRSRDASLLAESIYYLYHNPGIAQKMGIEGRKRIIKYFAVDKYVDSHEKLYQEILNSRK